MEFVFFIKIVVCTPKLLCWSPAELPVPSVEITASSNETRVGQSLNITCSVTTVNGLSSPPQVEFIGPSGDPIMMGDDPQISSSATSGTVTTVQVEFPSLTTSDGGRYTCRARLSAPGIENISSEAHIVISIAREYIPLKFIIFELLL